MQSIADQIRASANRLGISPLDLATVMSYETIGTFDPRKRGGADNKYVGLIQMGPEERKRYGGGTDQDFSQNLLASERYLKSRGVKPGMGLLDLYSTVNAGSPGHYDASDGYGTVRTHVAQMLESGHREKAANLLDMKYRPAAAMDRPNTENAIYGDVHGGEGTDKLVGQDRPRGATIIGGLLGSDNMPQAKFNWNAGQESGDESDNLDTPEWLGLKPATAATAVAPVAAPTSGAPMSRPAGPLDSPVTENTPVSPDGEPTKSSSQARIASRVVYKNGQPEFELYDPDAEAKAKIETLPEEQAQITGNAGSNELRGGDSTDEDDILEPAAKSSPTSSDEDDLLEPATKTSPDDHHSAMNAKAAAALEEATTVPPLTPNESSIVGLDNLMNNVTLGLGHKMAAGASALLGQGTYDENMQKLESNTERWRQEHPMQGIAQGVVGPLPATMAGMGIAGRALTAAGESVAGALPSVAPAIAKMGQFLSGELGSWAGSAWDKIAKLGNLSALGAVEGATQATLTNQLTSAPLGEDAATGALVGGLLGPIGGAAGHLLTKALTSDIVAGAKQTYQRAAQVFTNPKALPMVGRIAESDALRAMHGRLMEGAPETANLRAWTDQAMEFAGSHRKAATLENLEENSQAIGRHFDAVIQAAHVAEDPQLHREMFGIYTDLQQNMHRGSQFNALRDEMHRIADDLQRNGNVLSPELYQSITKSTSKLGSMIRGKDGETAQYAKNIQTAILDWVDRGYTATGPGFMSIPGLGKGTPKELYGLARKRWKLNETMIDSVHASGNYSGVLDPQAFAQASKARGRQISDDPNDPQRALVMTSSFMPEVTKQGSAVIGKSWPLRVISNIVRFENAPAAAASFGTLAQVAQLGFPSVIGAAAIGGVSAAMRNSFLRRRLSSPDFTNELLGDPSAIARESGRRAARRNALTGAGIGIEREREGQ